MKHYQPAVRFTDRTSLQGDPNDDEHREMNFNICRAIDMIKVGIVLENLVKAGKMKKEHADLFHTQAGSLLATIRTEINRAYGF